MKNINKTDLHINNIVNVLKYIVFIMVLVFMGFLFKEGNVDAASSCKTAYHTSRPENCEDPLISSDSTLIRFYVKDVDAAQKSYVYLKFCDYGEDKKNCSEDVFLANKTGYKPEQVDVEIYLKDSTRNGNSREAKGIYFEYYYDRGLFYSAKWSGWEKKATWSSFENKNYRVYLYVAADLSGKRVDFVCAYVDYEHPNIEYNVDGTGYSKSHTVSFTAKGFSPYRVFYKWSSESTNPKDTYTHCIVDDSIFLSECANAGFSSSLEADHDLNSFNITKSSGNGDYYLHVLAQNTTGTSVRKIVGPIKFDNAAPSFASSLDNSTWKKENKIWVEYTDVGGSGVSHLMYCTSLDCTPSTKVNLSKDGKFYISVGNLEGKVPITFFAVDKAGNETTNKTIYYKFDYIAPTLKSRTNSPPYNGWYKGGNTIDFVFSDKGTASNQSNISKIEMCVKESSKTCTPIDIGRFAATSEKTVSVKLSDFISQTGTYSFSFIVTDVAGNIYTNTSVGTYKVDLTGPTLPSNGKVVTNDGIRQSHEATFTFTDTGSGIYKIYYCWIKSSVGTCTPNKEVANGGKITEKSLDGKYILNVKARDWTENWSDVISVEFEFDNTAPDFSIEYVTEEEENSIEVISEVSFMEYEDLEEEIEVVDEVSEEIEVVEIKEEIKIEENEVEIVSVKPLVIEMVHVPVTTDSVHYILSGLRSSIVIGGTCLFLKERKRVNVS